MPTKTPSACFRNNRTICYFDFFILSMLNKAQKLAENILDMKAVSRVPTRDGYGKGVVEAGEKDARVVVLCADLAESTRSHWFKEKFPARYVELGVAEQNLATIGAGAANYG